tara:strand:- start:513 stop:1229 length:717 start_codon:yes stop_codon:yes gene_type:complete
MSEQVKLELFEFAASISPKLVNINAFKNLERLKGARVFNILFGFEDHSFTKKPLEKNQKGAITLLKTLDITYNNWILFTNFIINNRIEGLEEYNKFKDEPRYNGLTHNLSELDKICNKLGGIPVFDTFIEDFYESDKNKKNKNFMKPEEDLDNTYVWMTYRDNGLSSTYEHFIRTICPPNRGWSCVGRQNHVCYFRRPRNIIIPPMGPPNYTPPETSEDDEEIGHEFDEQGIPIVEDL